MPIRPPTFAPTPRPGTPPRISGTAPTGGFRIGSQGGFSMPGQGGRPTLGVPGEVGIPPAAGPGGVGGAGAGGGVDINALLRAAGIGGGGAGGGTGGGGGGPDFSNVAQSDPNLAFLSEEIKKQIANPGASTGRAIDIAGSKIRDLAEGQKASAKERFARLGSSGAGAEGEEIAGIEQDVASRVAGTAADITQAEEQARRGFLLGSAGALGAQGAASRADRELALRQWSEQQQNQRAAQQAQQQQQLAILNLLGGLVGR